MREWSSSGFRLQNWCPGSHGNCPGLNQGGRVSRVKEMDRWRGSQILGTLHRKNLIASKADWILGSSAKRTVCELPGLGSLGGWESCPLAPSTYVQIRCLVSVWWLSKWPALYYAPPWRWRSVRLSIRSNYELKTWRSPCPTPPPLSVDGGLEWEAVQEETWEDECEWGEPGKERAGESPQSAAPWEQGEGGVFQGDRVDGGVKK